MCRTAGLAETSPVCPKDHLPQSHQVAMVAVGSLFPFWPSYPLSFTLLPRLVCRARPLLEPRGKTRVAVAWPPAVSFPARMGPPSLYTRGLGTYLCLVSPTYPCPPRSFMATRCLIFRACYRLWLPGFLGPETRK